MALIKNFKENIRKYRYQLNFAKRIYRDQKFFEIYKISKEEGRKKPLRTEIISFLIEFVNGTNYLEIGVRNPEDNFNKINCKNKFSVDPGIEFKENPVDFKMTSDKFFQSLRTGNLDIDPNIKFDVIFIDGLHLAEQADKDILNSLDLITDSGFIVLHDCNPPSEFHARESFRFRNSPARGFWNGTTWKAFYKFRHQKDLYSICFDTDWGVGVISKTKYPQFDNLELPMMNPYFEYIFHSSNRKSFMNLYSFDIWKKGIE